MPHLIDKNEFIVLIILSDELFFNQKTVLSAVNPYVHFSAGFSSKRITSVRKAVVALPWKQGDQMIGRKFAQIFGKVAQTVANPNILTICS